MYIHRRLHVEVQVIANSRIVIMLVIEVNYV